MVFHAGSKPLPIRVTVLGPQDGKAHVGDMARMLAKAARAGHVNPDDLSVAFLDEKIKGERPLLS